MKSVWKYIKKKLFESWKLKQSKNGQTVALIHLARSQVCCWWLKNQKRDSKGDRNMAWLFTIGIKNKVKKFSHWRCYVSNSDCRVCSLVIELGETLDCDMKEHIGLYITGSMTELTSSVSDDVTISNVFEVSIQPQFCLCDFCLLFSYSLLSFLIL